MTTTITRKIKTKQIKLLRVPFAEYLIEMAAMNAFIWCGAPFLYMTLAVVLFILFRR